MKTRRKTRRARKAKRRKVRIFLKKLYFIKKFKNNTQSF